MATKNMRDGRIKLYSGDVWPLEKLALFTEGDFTFAKPRNVKKILTRGTQSHLRRGDDEAVSWSFTAKFVDKTLRRTLEEFIWDAFAEVVTGLTANANNPDFPLRYAYLQDSLVAASGETIGTKLANGATPTGTNEFAELVGFADVENENTIVDPGTFDVYPPLADTDMSVVYDAIGKSTLDPINSKDPNIPTPCPSDRKTFLIVLEKLNIVDPTNTLVDEAYEINHAYVESVEQGEGDDYDTLTFNGMGFVRSLGVSKVGGVIHVEISDSILMTDALPNGDVVIS